MKLVTLLFTMALAAKAQSNYLDLCDVQSTQHCVRFQVPSTISADKLDMYQQGFTVVGKSNINGGTVPDTTVEGLQVWYNSTSGEANLWSKGTSTTMKALTFNSSDIKLMGTSTGTLGAGDPYLEILNGVGSYFLGIVYHDGDIIPFGTTNTYKSGGSSNVWKETWTRAIKTDDNALNVTGASTTNGNIVLTPGAVAGNASVSVLQALVNQPAMYWKEISGTTSAPTISKRDSGNVARWYVMGHTDASTPDAMFTADSFPTATNTFNIGKSGAIYANFWGNQFHVADPNGSDLMTLSTAQAVTGVKDWQANITFGTDNTYNLGTFAKQAQSFYAHAIQSQKIQFGDSAGVSSNFWYVNASATATSQFSLVDNSGNVAFQIFRSGTGSPKTVLYGNVLPDATGRSLGVTGGGFNKGWFDSGGIEIQNAGTFTMAGTTIVDGTTLNMFAPANLQVATNLTVSTGIIKIGATTVIDASRNGTFATLAASSTFTLSAISGSTQCLQANSSGVVSGTGASCASAGVTSLVATSPIAVSGSTGAITISCANCDTINTAQTITAVKNFAANITVNADNTYSIGSFSTEPQAIYGRAIQSQKVQFGDSGGTSSNFWYASVSATATSQFSLIDNSGNTAFQILRSGAGSPKTVLYGNVLPDTTGRSLGVTGGGFNKGWFDSGGVEIQNSGTFTMNGTTIVDGSTLNMFAPANMQVAVNLTVATGVIKVGATTIIDASRNASFAALSATSVSNLNLQSGNTYLRTFSGAPSCASVADGWVGYDSTGDHIYVCQGGVARAH